MWIHAVYYTYTVCGMEYYVWWYCLFCVLMVFSFYFFCCCCYCWIISMSMYFYKHVYDDIILQKSQMLPFLNADGFHIGEDGFVRQAKWLFGKTFWERRSTKSPIFLIGAHHQQQQQQHPYKIYLINMQNGFACSLCVSLSLYLLPLY